MILEGIVTTVSPSGTVNIAPMGPSVAEHDSALEHFLLRPFPTSQTCRNLEAHGEGVLHVTDDVLLLARAAVGPVDPPPPLVPAAKVRGYVLQDACRSYEFQVRSIDSTQQRVRIECAVVHRERCRDFFGFNRAKHAVLEAAILATRTAVLPMADIDSEFQKLGIIVSKTGGQQETAAFAFLQAYLRHVAATDILPL